MKSYKNNALNPEEMRRRREEEGIQLRKQKREQQVSHLQRPLSLIFKIYLLLYVSTLSLASDTPEEGVRPHYGWLLGFQLRTFRRAVGALNC